MQINVKKLKERGVTVRCFDEFGNLVKGNGPASVEIFPENGKPLPVEVVSAVRALLGTPEYANVAVESLARKVQTLQVLEAIESTED